VGFEVGARAGVSLARWYAGVSFIYSFGDSVSGYTQCGGPIDPTGRTTCGPGLWSNRSLRYGIAAGYGFEFGHWLTVRPQLTGGLMMFYSDVSILTPAGTTLWKAHHTFGPVGYVEPGIVVILPVRPLILGVEFNVRWPPAATSPNVANAAFTAHGELGLRL
jgi:hypothetical protein